MDHLKIFANTGAADRWFEKNDPEGVAFEYPARPRLDGPEPGARITLDGMSSHRS